MFRVVNVAPPPPPEHGHGEYEADGVFESKGALDVDPAHPQVFLLVGKWYKRPEELLQLMSEVYPPPLCQLLSCLRAYMLCLGYNLM